MAQVKVPASLRDLEYYFKAYFNAHIASMADNAVAQANKRFADDMDRIPDLPVNAGVPGMEGISKLSQASLLDSYKNYWTNVQANFRKAFESSKDLGKGFKGRAKALKRIIAVLEECGLGAKYLNRRPNELSGGQRQRIAIAMCLIQEPALIVADEPFSSLDASSSAELLKLMTDINRERHTAFLLITHNIHIVRQICPRIIVMDEGRICEEGTTAEVLTNPRSECTAALLEAERRIHGI